MNKELIEKVLTTIGGVTYKKICVNNPNVRYIYEDEYITDKNGFFEINYIELITSKEFLVSVCKYLQKEGKVNRFLYKGNGDLFLTLKQQQAKAIREKWLDNFFKSIVE